MEISQERMNPGFTKQQTSSNWLSGGKCSSGYCASLRSFWPSDSQVTVIFLDCELMIATTLASTLALVFNPGHTQPGVGHTREIPGQDLIGEEMPKFRNSPPFSGASPLGGDLTSIHVASPPLGSTANNWRQCWELGGTEPECVGTVWI